MDILELPELALGGHAVLGPQPADHADGFFKTCPALGHRYAKHLEFLGQKSTAESGFQPAIAHVVQHRQITSQVCRVMEGRDHRTGHQPYALGARRNRRKEDTRVGRVAAVIIERMLYRLDAIEAQRVGTLSQGDALLVVLSGRAVTGAK